MNELHDAIARGLVDRGLLIAAGFAGLATTPLCADKTPAQLEDLKVAYMSGAQHLWASIMAIMDHGLEPTDADMRRMGLISDEMEAWSKRLAARLVETKGTA